MAETPAATTIDRARLLADLTAIADAIVDRIPITSRMLLRARGVDISTSTRAICDELAALPDDDLDLILRVIRWETHALLGGTSDPLRTDQRTRSALARVIDVLTTGL